MTFVYARPNASPHAGELGPIQNVEDDYELVRGVPQEDFPSDASFEMDEDFGVRLDDVVPCLGRLMVISDRLRAFLEDEDLPNTQMLPVTIHDLKGRALDTPFFVFHQTHLVDALDLEASEVEANAINPAIISHATRIALRQDALDPETRVFRLAKYPMPIWFESGLAERVLEAGFTGIAFGEVEDYDAYEIL